MKKFVCILSVVLFMSVVFVVSLGFEPLKAQSEENEEPEGDRSCSCLPSDCYSVYYEGDPDYSETDGGNNKYDKGQVFYYPLPQSLSWTDRCFGVGDNRLCEYWCYDSDQNGIGTLECQTYICNCSNGECP